MPGNKENKSKRTGDKLFIAEKNISFFSDEADKSLYDSQRDFSAELPDVIRYLNGSFWTAPTGKSKLAGTFFKNKFKNVAPILSFKMEQEYAPNPRTGYRDVEVQIKCPSDDRDDWSSQLAQFLEQVGNGETPFFDHASKYNIYEEGSNEEEQSSGLLNMYANVKSEYNFLQREYEEAISDSSIPEVALPNFYNFMLRDHRRMDMRILLGHRGRLPVSEQVFASANPEVEYTPVNSYFRAWARDLEEWKLDARYEEFNNKMSHIEFTKNETDMMEELFKYKESFPMFNTLEFTVEEDAKFGTVFEDTNFMPYLKSFLKPENEKRLKTSEIRYKRSVKTGDITPLDVNPGGIRTFYDIDDFFNNYQNEEGDISNSIYFSDVPITEENRTYYHLMSIICKGRVQKIKKEVVRTYEEIMEGKTAYNEIIFYEVKKYDEGDNLLQTFHFTNTDELDMIKYVDTQVKYGHRYRYDISSINVVVGTSYVYKYDQELNQNAKSTGVFTFNVEIEPSVKMIKVPMIEKSILIYDNPPIAPEVTIVPFAGVNDKIRILMDTGVGRYMIEPISFSNKDNTDIEKFKIAQDLPMESKKIKYETDDHTETFLIYRMDTEPYSYEDFITSGTLTYVSTVQEGLSATRYNAASSAGYDDMIEPNKKYYYCFRSIDYHKHNSYPTDVFSVEIVEDSGSVYPIIKIHEFRKPETKQIKRGVKRFFSVKPAMRNLLVNEEASGFDPEEGPDIGQDIVFGRGDDTTWKKKFKIRLTSKSTGRKVDFNFSFDYINKKKEDA